MDKAVASLLKLLASGPSHSVNAVMLLNGMGEINRAFEVADAYLLERGPIMASVRWHRGEVSVNDQRRRKTNMLFVPVSAEMRSDKRFLKLAEEIGLTDYWRRLSVEPDFSRPNTA